MKCIWSFIIAILFIPTSACSKNDEIKKDAPKFISSTPQNNAANVSISTVVEVVFDEGIKLASNHEITINAAPANIKTSVNKLIFTEKLDFNTSYKINIPKGALVNSFDIPLKN